MAAAQPPAMPVNFLADDGFPDDLFLLVLDRVPCKDDRASMSLVCKPWRNRLARLRGGGVASPPPPLPWMLLPSRSRADPAISAACVLSGCCVHPHHKRLSILPPMPRFVGSYDGAWIFLQYGQARAHGLFNLRTGRVRMLPEALVRDVEGHQIVYKMAMLAATLSSTPEDSNCVVARVHAGRDDVVPQPLNRWIAFWRMGWETAFQVLPGVDVAEDLNIFLTEDVIYYDYDSTFLFLLIHGGNYHILHSKPTVNADHPTLLNILYEVRRFVPLRELMFCDNAIRAGYLVFSRGEVLLVVRLAIATGATNQQTAMFKVFRAMKRPQMPDADFPVAAYPWAWSELDTLDGRILFVGYGCSRSYDAADYPSFKAGIYFLDDGKFYNEAAFFRSHNMRPYPCRDNGRWCEGSVQLCFPTADPSDHSPPVWLLP